MIIESIKTRIKDRVKSAIENGLTGWQKARVFLGTLNLDDIIGSDFKNFPDLLSTPITLAFPFKTGQRLSYGDAGTPGNVSNPMVVGFGGWLDFKFLFAGRNAAGENHIYAVSARVSSDNDEIEGNLQVQPVRVDHCKAEVSAVKATQSAADGVDAEIRALQAELHHAPPSEQMGSVSDGLFKR